MRRSYPTRRRSRSAAWTTTKSAATQAGIATSPWPWPHTPASQSCGPVCSMPGKQKRILQPHPPEPRRDQTLAHPPHRPPTHTRRPRPALVILAPQTPTPGPHLPLHTTRPQSIELPTHQHKHRCSTRAYVLSSMALSPSSRSSSGSGRDSPGRPQCCRTGAPGGSGCRFERASSPADAFLASDAGAFLAFGSWTRGCHRWFDVEPRDLVRVITISCKRGVSRSGVR